MVRGCHKHKASIRGSTKAVIREVNLEQSAVMDTVKVVLFLLSRKKKCQFLKNSLRGKFWFLKTALNLLKSPLVTFSE